MKIIKVLQGPAARYLPATGVMLVSRSVQAIREMLMKSKLEPDEQDEILTFVHECVHHLQVLSSAYLWLDAVSRLNASIKVVLPRNEEDRTTGAQEITRRERAFRYRAFGVSCADLCEGAAVLESYKARAASPEVDEFLRWREAAFPGKGNSVYHRTFDVMAERCGKETAFDLLPVITLLALQGEIPGQNFEYMMRNSKIRDTKLIGAQAKDVAEALDCGIPNVMTPDAASRLHPSQQHPTLYPAVLETLKNLGENALEAYARPHRLLRPIQTHAMPPLLIGAHALGGVCQAGYGAGESKELRRKLVMFTALVAAAERIVTGRLPFVPCFHSDCPNYDSGMCGGWYVPPPEADLCGYRAEIKHSSGKELHQIATECTQLPKSAVIEDLQTTDDLERLFADAEILVERSDEDHLSVAEEFDERHDLDAEDNDALAVFECRTCQVMVQEWVSHRKMKRGYVAVCPKCGTEQEMGADRGFKIHMDNS